MEPKQRSVRLASIFKIRELNVLLALLIVGALISLATPYFLAVDNLMGVFRPFSLTAITAIGMVMAIVTGGIDLSVGSVLGLSSLMTAFAFLHGFSMPVAIASGLLSGLGVGVFNGILITWIGLPPFIPTLGSLSIGRGAIYMITHGEPLTPDPAARLRRAGPTLRRVCSRPRHRTRRPARRSAGVRSCVTPAITASSLATPPMSPGDTAYVTWRDGGLSLVDVSDQRNPRTIVHRNWCPPDGGGTHNALPLPDRDLLVVVDEAVQDQCADGMKFTWLFDIREPTNPISIATVPTPPEIDYVAKGAHFGPHNVHGNRPGSFVSSERIFTTYQNAGVRVFDIRNPHQPAEIGALVAPPPTKMMDIRTGRARVIQSADIFVDRDQLVYCTDTNAGLYIMEMTG